jgi:hypothetical protein
MCSNFLSDIFEYAESSPANSNLTQSMELGGDPISVKNDMNNWGFILFLVCFFIFVYIVSQRIKLLFSMASGLFRNKDRQSIFFETVNNEFLNKFLLGFQTTILASIILYCQAVHEQVFSSESPFRMFLFMGISSLILLVFILYKFLTYTFIGNVFFKKDVIHQWNDNFFSLICLSGNVLFFPALILFYVEQAYFFCMYFIFIYLFFITIVIFYKIYVLFFQGKRLLLYFILYLCTQEIIPLFLIYRGLTYLFIIVQKDTL